MLEYGSMSAVVVEVDGSVSYCNDHFASLVGYQRDEIIGRDRSLVSAVPVNGKR